MFQVSQRVRAGASRAAWEGTWKHFVQVTTFTAVLWAGITPNRYNWLNRIHLHLQFDQYFKLFDMAINPTVHMENTQENGRQLQALLQLKHLEFFFPLPYGLYFERSANPWHNFYTQHKHKASFKSGPNYREMEHYPCQKTIVDWILTFAFPFVKHVPNIHLAGSVKPVTNNKWEARIECEYRDRRLDCRTHGYDHAENLAAVLHQPAYA